MSRTVTIDVDLLLNLLVYAETRAMQLARIRAEALQRVHASGTPANYKAYAGAAQNASRALDAVREVDALLAGLKQPAVEGRVVARGLKLAPPPAPASDACGNCGRRSGAHAAWCPVIPLEERVLPLVPASENVEGPVVPAARLVAHAKTPKAVRS